MASRGVVASHGAQVPLDPLGRIAAKRSSGDGSTGRLPNGPRRRPLCAKRWSCLRPEQLSALVTAAERDDPVLATAIALAALTGARRGELVALRWSDVDLARGRVRIARSLTVARGEQHTGPTKTHAVRDLALDPVCVEVLKRRWASMLDLSARAESPLVADPYVLTYNANGAEASQPRYLHSPIRKALRGDGRTSAQGDPQDEAQSEADRPGPGRPLVIPVPRPSTFQCHDSDRRGCRRADRGRTARSCPGDDDA